MTRSDFNHIIDRNFRKLYLVAYSILKNTQEAEDAVQDVFLRLWMMKEKLVEYNDITALGVTMTRNNCIDILRKHKRTESGKESMLVLFHDQSPSPYEEMVRSENREILAEIIDDLPAEWAELIHLREIEGRPYEEIADMKSMNVNNLRVILSRARQMIREKYLKYTYERRTT